MKIKNILPIGVICSSNLIVATTHGANEKVSASISLDYNSHFISYGANVWGTDTEDIGDEALFNPSASVEFSITDTSAIYTGIWADVNGLADANIGNDVQEIDVWIGYYFSVGEFTFDLAYQAWMYAGENEGIIDFTVSYDAMFSPYLKAHNRVEAVGSQNKGTIFELGATLYETEYESWSFSFPIAVAFNLDEYHVDDEDGFAYALIGANFSYALPISDAYGAWDIHGGLTYYQTDEDNVGNPDEGILTANFGVGVSF